MVHIHLSAAQTSHLLIAFTEHAKEELEQIIKFRAEGETPIANTVYERLHGAAIFISRNVDLYPYQKRVIDRAINTCRSALFGVPKG